MINYIKQNFEFSNDIERAIINQKPIITKLWKSTKEKCKSDDPETRKTENKWYKIEFMADYDSYQTWEQIYKSFATKACALF